MHKGPPMERTRLVTRMKIGPRFFFARALAPSRALVEAAGYCRSKSESQHSSQPSEQGKGRTSPPVPKPMIPRAMVSIQKKPSILSA